MLEKQQRPLHHTFNERSVNRHDSGRQLENYSKGKTAKGLLAKWLLLLMYHSSVPSKEKCVDHDVLILRNLFTSAFKMKDVCYTGHKETSPELTYSSLLPALILFFLSPFEGQQCFYESPASDSAGWLLNYQGWLRNLLTYKLLRWLENVNAGQSLLTEEISYCCPVLLGLRLMVLFWLEVWLLLFTNHLHKDHFGYGDDCDTAMFPWEPSVFCGWLEKRYLFWLTVSGSKSSRKHDGT